MRRPVANRHPAPTQPTIPTGRLHRDPNRRNQPLLPLHVAITIAIAIAITIGIEIDRHPIPIPTDRGGDVPVALSQSYSRSDEDIASPSQAHERGGDVHVALGDCLDPIDAGTHSHA
jgi:hypothetical protein